MADLVAALNRHERIGIDTIIFVYHFEASQRHVQLTRMIFDALAGGSFAGVTSLLTLMELVVRPLQLDRPDVADEYELLVARYPNMTIAGVDRSVVRQAAELRATHRLSTPDALQIASSLGEGATGFLTNDRRLRRVQEIEAIILDDFV